MSASIQFTNYAEVIAGFERRKNGIEGGLMSGGKQGLVIGNNYIMALAPYDTGNLSNSYPRCATIKIIRPYTVELTWTSDVDYAPHQEFIHHPHLRPGVHQAWPEVVELVSASIRGQTMANDLMSDLAGAVGAFA
jgi:hypothetical protein